MTTQQTEAAAAEDRLCRVMTDLSTVFKYLGAEHQALRAEEEKATAHERRGTLSRMGQNILQAARTVSSTVETLATVHGLRDAGVTQLFSEDAEGRDYSSMGCLPSAVETLFEALTYLDEAVTALSKAYTPTKKYPALAKARCPERMSVALSSLRAAVKGLCAEAAEIDEEVAESYGAAQDLLTQLERRVCRPVPAQSSGPTADEVVAAIRSNADVARAAAEALGALA
ncbi:hypothetical protein K388_07175 [Streptomyces sp. KhCrAH-43]|uniref:hypothetical protein n=1 Tax=unclassified Streptomyces TaxID=2593676 RepID=UPI0003809567|nr:MULTISPECIES: hypothetical protein [unclassified Streptomyces]MYS36377.1 hypothetical protein [Streptomyces sp. SID4920]MYX63940.1 hypothetical protein [Streptomyces sp. SID8373]RAJ47794.1 hypothetical protein K388_07175 [Streptomyces sp. KhCrAH-43]